MEILHPVDLTRRAYVRFAVAGSAILALFTLVAMLFSARLSWRSHQERELRPSYRIATEGGNDGFYLLQPVYNVVGAIIDFHIVDCNERAAALYGVDKARLMKKTWSALYPSGYFAGVLQIFATAMHSGFHVDEFEVPDISPVRVKWVRRRMVRTGTRLALTLQDISDTKSHKSELSRMAHDDELTGLPNRSGLMQTLSATLSGCVASGELMAVAMISLDDFKNLNNAFGHAAGDELLKAVASRLKAVLRPVDKAARLSSDEFALVLECLIGESSYCWPAC